MCYRSLFIKHIQNPQWEKRMSHWTSLSTPLMVLFIYPSWSNFSTSLVEPPKQMVFTPTHGQTASPSMYLPTRTIRLGSLQTHSFLIPGSECVTNDRLGMTPLIFLCFTWLERNCVSLMLTAWWMGAIQLSWLGSITTMVISVPSE